MSKSKLEEVKLKEDEFVPEFSKQNPGFYTENSFWEKVCIKPITPKEAIETFTTAINTKEQPSFYFWDDEDDKFQGHTFEMIGFNFKSSEYIVWNFVGCPIYKKHCGIKKLLDSDYLIPVNYDGTEKWIGACTYAKLIYEGISKEKLQPIYKTRLNKQRFYKKVEEEVENLRRMNSHE